MPDKDFDLDIALQKINAATPEGLQDFIPQLTHLINELLQHDFEKLLYLLYRIDIDEKQLKEALKDHPQTDAALMITQLIVKRQEEKQKTKQQFRQDDFIAEDEKW